MSAALKEIRDFVASVKTDYPDGAPLLEGHKLRWLAELDALMAVSIFGAFAPAEAKDRVCEAASDYFFGKRNAEFAEFTGGIQALENELEKATDAWTAEIQEAITDYPPT